MRYLAIDLGAKRTGLAVGDDGSGIVSPLTTLTAAHDEHLLQQLAPVLRDEQPEALVLGQPLNMDGSAGPSAKRAQGFAKLLDERFGLPVHLHDERLSSAAADEQMARTGLTRGQKKSRRDALAAAHILRAYFDAKAH